MKSWVLTIVIALVAILVILFASVSFLFGPIIKAYVNTTTPCTLEYNEWSGNLFKANNIKGLKLYFEKEGITAFSENAVITIDPMESSKKEGVVFNCHFLDVTFSLDKFGKNKDAFGVNSLLALPFSSGWTYKDISFIFEFSVGKFKVVGFTATSDQVKLSGKYDYTVSSGQMDLELTISFPPETTEEYLGEYKDFLFAPGEDGWYTATIIAQGTAQAPRISVKSALFEMNIRSE